jgi:L-2-hydroxyglutarate oxidase LhgO
MNPDFDVVVIGAGVIGLACAARLATKGMSVLVVEANGRFGEETSSRNSEVIHAGMYYPPGSLRARLCARGNRSLRAWCDAHRVTHSMVGKLIVATSRDEEGELDAIAVRAEKNGVEGLERVTGAYVTEREPNVIATAALWSPNTGVVDSHGFMASLLGEARAHGAMLALRHRVTAATGEEGGSSLQVEQADGETSTVSATRAINAAGLRSDDVAALPGLDVDALGYRLIYVKGRYFRLRGRRVSRLIYPVPAPKLLGLGVHVTIDLGGGERLGPDTEVLAGRALDYDVGDERREAFFRAASRYLRGLSLDDLSPDYAGIRPRLSRAGSGASDFVIAEEGAHGLPGWVNLVGIESPGLTCALEIADEVVALLA